MKSILDIGMSPLAERDLRTRLAGGEHHYSILRSNHVGPKFGWMLLVSLIIHCVVLSFYLGKPPDSSKKVFFSPVYSVNLVDMPSPSAAQKGQGTSKIRKGSMWKGPAPISTFAKATAKRSHPILTIPKQIQPKGTSGTAKKARETSSLNNAGTPGRDALADGGQHIGASQPASASDLRFSRYYQAIWTKIQQAWVLPSYDRQSEKQLEAIVILKIDRNGNILNINFEKKSGNSNLDRSVERAVKKAAPLPPLPIGFRESFLEVGIRFIPEG